MKQSVAVENQHAGLSGQPPGPCESQNDAAVAVACARDHGRLAMPITTHAKKRSGSCRATARFTESSAAYAHHRPCRLSATCSGKWPYLRRIRFRWVKPRTVGTRATHPAPADTALQNCAILSYPQPLMFAVVAAVLFAVAGILAVVTAERRRILHRFEGGPLSQGWLAARRSQDANQH